MAQQDFLMIGIDGGATEAKGHQIIISGPADKPVFKIGEINASRKYKQTPDFKSVDIPTQLKQRDAGAIELTDMEKKQGENIAQAAFEVISEIVKKAKAKKVLIGMGMPGLKTPDKRGISAMANGPRNPELVNMIEAKLAKAKIELVAPIPRLGSDADYCGIGEEYAGDGIFKDVKNAYYMGVGTGIADAMKLKGSLVPFDMTKEWLQKAWQIPCALGVTFEKLASAKWMNDFFYKYKRNASAAEMKKGLYPETEALNGDPFGIFTMDTVAMVIAELFYERIITLRKGREQLEFRGEAYLKLITEHPYKGLVFDKLIIGQRMGKLYSDKKFDKVFRKPLETYLAKFITESKDKKLISHYLENGKIKKDILVSSKLREAPAIGAAVDSYRATFLEK